MNYEKKYKEAQKWIESIYSELSHEQQMEAEAFFPELKESEDERIRKAILELVRQSYPILEKKNQEQMIAWLEKQGESKSAGKMQVSEKLYEHIRNTCACIDDALSSETLADVKDYLSQANYDAQSAFDMIGKQGEQKPADREFTFKAIPRLLEMIEPTNRTKEYCQKLIDSLIKEGYVVDAMIVGECLKHMNGEDVPMAIMDEQKPNNKVKPKFHEGEWITNGDYTWKIVDVKPLDYILQPQDGIIVDDTISHVDEQFHSFTIEDAKDGDVLACNNGWTCIFKTLVNDETFSSYCFMDKTKWFCETGSECHTLKEEFVKAYNGKIHPATKEQCDTLFAKMKETGYEWDAEKKELKKIEQKSAWSKEDTFKVQRICKYLDEAKKYYADITEVRDCIDWLKSIKERIGGNV